MALEMIDPLQAPTGTPCPVVIEILSAATLDQQGWSSFQLELITALSSGIFIQEWPFKPYETQAPLLYNSRQKKSIMQHLSWLNTRY